MSECVCVCVCVRARARLCMTYINTYSIHFIMSPYTVLPAVCARVNRNGVGPQPQLLPGIYSMSVCEACACV